MYSFPLGSCVDEDLKRDTAAETGCVPKLTSDPNLECTGKSGAQAVTADIVSGVLLFAGEVLRLPAEVGLH